jgi:hypothetical protein
LGRHGGPGRLVIERDSFITSKVTARHADGRRAADPDDISFLEADDDPERS